MCYQFESFFVALFLILGNTNTLKYAIKTGKLLKVQSISKKLFPYSAPVLEGSHFLYHSSVHFVNSLVFVHHLVVRSQGEEFLAISLVITQFPFSIDPDSSFFTSQCANITHFGEVIKRER